ncbi:hypothetical protein [Shouchella lonarensis]|uniref:Uncharacterized protein n=1 Tax=Shouchella lonarensis TaxID=1464122 RepID=A0A1G6KLQ8_9BACI|nr:hypothetical protein [Shouchella lonarensis]SDC31894.1 hypothetical protein SAMN05421737_10773 [Shouchella lonarensis]
MGVSEKKRSYRDLKPLEEKFTSSLGAMIAEHKLTEAALMYWLEKEKTREGMTESELQIHKKSFASVVPEFNRRLHLFFGELEESWETLKQEIVKCVQTAKQRKFVMEYVFERQNAVNSEKKKMRKLEKKLCRYAVKWGKEE